jgi:hypothetical protein
MKRFILRLFTAILLVCVACAWTSETKPARRYFAHEAVEDRYGVIAPWYRGQNGQFDFRVRVSEETLKRYPWTGPGQAVIPAPHFIFNGTWTIDRDGTITVNPELKDWDNGDIGQRSFGLLLSQVDYYRYSGDPAAIGIISMTADFVLDYCQTPADHPWPRFFISCPMKGKAYRQADPHGFIQLDISAYVGAGLVSAYKVTGNTRYWEAAKHWADLLAEHCDRRPGPASPWPRYANPEDVPAKDVLDNAWGRRNIQTGGVALILRFLDDVIRTGYRGKDDDLVKARDAGEKYIRDVILPEWSRDPTFGHCYWDWANPVYTFGVASFVTQYMMSRQEAFPNWVIDVRNIMSVAFCRLSVNPESMGGVYSGAWAIPEASNCCGKSLQYPTTATAAVFARYAALANDAWAREIARREAILWTYDTHDTGVIEDSIDGGTIVAGGWFNCGHTWPFRCLLEHMAWQPELTGAGRENHIMRSSPVVTEVQYGKGEVAYRTYDAAAPTEDVLRLAFVPESVSAGGEPLPRRDTLTQNGYTVKALSNGDCIVTIRHDGLRDVVVKGDDPQETAEDGGLSYKGTWRVMKSTDASKGELRVAETAGADVSLEFDGNQVRLLGSADPAGGRADVYLDGVKQPCGVDFWCPQSRNRQIMWYKNGLEQGRHLLKIVALGAKNPRSSGTRVYVDSLQWSAAQGEVDRGEGQGPDGPQRVIFGYVGREDYVDSQGRAWRPATEFTMRHKPLADLVALSFWTAPRLDGVSGTGDPELYRYGVHGKDFTAHFTVDPRLTYHVRIKFCQAEAAARPGEFATTIEIQGKPAAADVDVAAAAGGTGKSYDLTFDDIKPENGVIAVRFLNPGSGEAMVQAIEIAPNRSASRPATKGPAR